MRYVKFIGYNGPKAALGRIPEDDERVPQHFHVGFLILHEAPSKLGDRVIIYDRGPRIDRDQASFEWEEHDRFAVSRLPVRGSGRPHYTSWATDVPAALVKFDRMLLHDDEQPPRHPRLRGGAGRIVWCPYDCGFSGTEEEVDDHRVDNHKDEVQQGSNLAHRPRS